MRTLLIALSFVALSLSANAADEVIKVKVYDVYKTSVDIKKAATNIRIQDFKFKNAKSKKITYRTTCYRNDNDRKMETLREEYSCVKVKFERVLVARVKFRYDTIVVRHVGGGRDGDDRMEEVVVSNNAYFNTKVSELDAATIANLESRTFWSPRRSEFRAIAKSLFSLNVLPTRNSLKVSITAM